MHIWTVSFVVPFYTGFPFSILKLEQTLCWPRSGYLELWRHFVCTPVWQGNGDFVANLACLFSLSSISILTQQLPFDDENLSQLFKKIKGSFN